MFPKNNLEKKVSRRTPQNLPFRFPRSSTPKKPIKKRIIGNVSNVS